jgi:hypothetical protein
MTKVAVLDDYQGRASGFGDWGSLGREVDVTFLRETLAPDELVPTLSPFLMYAQVVDDVVDS